MSKRKPVEAARQDAPRGKQIVTKQVPTRQSPPLSKAFGIDQPPLTVSRPEERIIDAPLEAPPPIEYVKCRYCGRKITKPSDGSTFYQCFSCPGTGEHKKPAGGV